MGRVCRLFYDSTTLFQFLKIDSYSAGGKLNWSLLNPSAYHIKLERKVGQIN